MCQQLYHNTLSASYFCVEGYMARVKACPSKLSFADARGVLWSADTVTIPDEEMLRRMVSASVGDDMYKQDQATNALEARVAKLTGKEAAMFVVSGTMANRESQVSRIVRVETEEVSFL